MNIAWYWPSLGLCGSNWWNHVRAFVPIKIQGRFRGRKEGIAQNVLVAIMFDLRFTYMLASGEGSAHDSCILNDALSRPKGLKIPKGII